MNKLYEIDIDRIVADQNQPRKTFDETELKELADSIKIYGLIQPIIVKPNNNKVEATADEQTYTIVAGERRFRASQIAGCRNINVLIRTSTDSMEVSLIENMQRKDLNKIEEAAAIKHIMAEKGYTQEKMAQVLSKSRPYITNALRLLNLSPQLQQALIDEKISDAHARVIVGIKEEKERIKLLEKIINEKMSVREAERHSKRLREDEHGFNIFLRAALDQLEDAMECRIYTKGSPNSKSGTLCISYFSEEELEVIIQALMDRFVK
ncbi:MAG: ParB/RepB/Spo0J family partition protein [Peptostreptococcaceae bacterium]|nr:ParB/RepB/Spo0J family partition protein [Peptostreptococcaceae bacterium]